MGTPSEVMVLKVRGGQGETAGQVEEGLTLEACMVLPLVLDRLNILLPKQTLIFKHSNKLTGKLE